MITIPLPNMARNAKRFETIVRTLARTCGLGPRLDTVVDRVVYGILTASLFLGSAMMWSRQAPPTIYGISVFGAAGSVAAIVLAWRLLRATKKEGGFQK
jgi:hypothetical protein